MAQWAEIGWFSREPIWIEGSEKRGGGTKKKKWKNDDELVLMAVIRCHTEMMYHSRKGVAHG